MSERPLRTGVRLLPFVFVLGACTVKPSVPLPAPLPARVATFPLGPDSLRVVAEVPFLRAPRLDSLIAGALRRHPTITAAAATLRQSEELLGARRGSTQWPQVDGAVAAQRQRFNPAILGQQTPAKEFTLLTASVSARYTFDLFGANRQALTALRLRVDFQRYELERAHVALASALATAAVNRAWHAAMLEDWQQLEALEEARVAMILEQRRLGGASDEAVAVQERALEAVRAARARQARVLAQSEHALTMLSGEPPGTAPAPAFVMADFSPTWPQVDSLPSTLVLARPDIRAADALMRTAHADYGAMVARAYPQLQLNASTASQALAGGALFGPGTAVYSLLSQLTQPLLQRGLPAERRAALANFEAAAAHYQGVVLESWRNVSDQMAALQWQQREVAALTRADASAHASAARLREQVELGGASRWQLLGAQQAAGQARLAFRLGQLQQLTELIAWYEAVPGALSAGF